MEVIEIISNFANKDNNVLEVEFRLRNDDENTLRSDTIEFEYLNDFGYITNLNLDIFEDIDDEWELDFEDDEDFFIDEDELISFLNEYYTVYNDRLPDAEYI